jgi:hypothetical protein
VTLAELREDVAIELEALKTIVQELISLRADVADHDLTVRELTAAAAFLAQFYNGVENILKRLSSYHNVPLPTGETWHVDLFRRFCSPPYRRFRHVAFHSYGFQIEWSRMAEGVARVEHVFSQLTAKLTEYLQTLESAGGSSS